jgi:hypothetical protein
MLVTIPVSLLSMKHLLFEYNKSIVGGVIRLNASDELYAQLCYNVPNDNAIKADEILTSSLKVDVSNRLASHINFDNLHRIGMFLHRLHIKTMCRDCAQCSTDLEVFDSLRHWLKQRAIFEEDYAFETAVKRFYRFRKENSDFFRRFQPTLVLQNGEIILPKKKHLMPTAELDKLIEVYQNKYPNHFKSAKGLTLKKMFQHLSIYVYRNIGNYPPQYVAKKFGVSERVGRYCNHKFMIYLKRHPLLMPPKDIILPADV